jgi:methyltransferase (TIGR00027 family)
MVAAYRLGFERLSASFGDPAADEALARDVAGDTPPAATAAMDRYLRARTAFFDRVVVNAAERGVMQMVNLGAGYDGRSLRYGKTGVRWWEVDRSATQSDKRERLARLDLDAGHVSFVEHDLADGGLAAALLASGYTPDAAGLFICEGVAVYLDDAVLTTMLRDLRSLATVGTRLAMSLSTSPSPDGDPSRKERVHSALAELGEPTFGSMTSHDAAAVTTVTRWRPADISERAQRAGFLVAVPTWAADPDQQAPTRSTVGRYLDRMLYRAGRDTLAAHLENTYGTPVVDTRELDVGVHRVERADGKVWIARVFPAARALEAVRADAATLDWLSGEGFPSERCADPEPVSLHDGQPVLVTQFLPGRKAPANPGTFAGLGALLATLHCLQPPSTLRRPGGAWHHLVTDAGLAEQKAAAIELFGAARAQVAREDLHDYDTLAAGLEGLDELRGLPHGFVHPDPVPVNVVESSAGPTLIDWTGAGWAPRLASLGCLLWAASGHGAPSLDAAVEGYRSLISPDEQELSSLEGAVATPVVLACWNFATGRQKLDESAAWFARESRRIARAARRARDLFRGPSAPARRPSP